MKEKNKTEKKKTVLPDCGLELLFVVLVGEDEFSVSSFSDAFSLGAVEDPVEVLGGLKFVVDVCCKCEKGLNPPPCNIADVLSYQSEQ